MLSDAGPWPRADFSLSSAHPGDVMNASRKGLTIHINQGNRVDDGDVNFFPLLLISAGRFANENVQ